MNRCVDVVIVAYASEEVLPACLDSILDEPVVSSVTVVDHGDGGSAAIARTTHPGVRVLVDVSNPGFGAGQNRGAESGRADSILVLNPDARMVPGALIAGLEVIDSDPLVAAVQGIVRDATTGETERSQGRELGVVHLASRFSGSRRLLRFPIVQRLGRLSAVTRDSVDREPRSPTEVQALAATALLVRRAAFESVDGFDESYFLYGEDVDLCRRFVAAGWKLVALPQHWAIHRSGSSSSSFVEREIEWWSGTLTFAARWWSPGRFWLGMACGVAMAIRLTISCPRRRRDIFRLVQVPLRTRVEVKRSPASVRARPSPTPWSRRRR